uniref:Mis18 domain-containing protein n=1 Tax=Chelonoidis abingdonii TaxID=106734 RepID=A0A8C0H2F7_CHEAB
MAVRRCIQQLFQEPQVDGAITFERPDPVLRNWGRPPREDVAVPRGAKPQREPNSPGGGTLLRRGLRLEECALFHCRGCRSVLSDSLHLCAQEDRCLRVLVCFSESPGRQTLCLGSGAATGRSLGLDSPAAYYALYCHSCGLMVGFSLYSAFAALVHLRGLFCLFKDNILWLVHTNMMDNDELEIKSRAELFMGREEYQPLPLSIPFDPLWVARWELSWEFGD